MEQPSLPAGRLGTRGAIHCGICYAVLQAMFITGSIASQYRVMVYHVDFVNIDLSKIAPLARIWAIFCEFNFAAHAVVPGNATVSAESSGSLDELLHAYSQSHTTAIHVYKGFFDANVILSPKIKAFVTASVTSALPWTLNVDSVDFVTIIYSMLVLCNGIIYTMKVKDFDKNDEVCSDTIITPQLLNDTYCQCDWLFWIILFVEFFLLLEITAAVSVVYVSLLYSVNFTFMLYTACAAAYCPVHALKYLSFALWIAYAFLSLVFTDASVLDGICLIVMHAVLCFFYYNTVVDADITAIRFLNIRLWTITILNFLFVVTYVNNVIYMQTKNTT